MKKILSLSLLCFLLLGCNLNVNKRIDKAFKFKNKINFNNNLENKSKIIIKRRNKEE